MLFRSGNIRNKKDLERYKSTPIFVYYNDCNHYDALLVKDGYSIDEIINQLKNSTQYSCGVDKEIEQEWIKNFSGSSSKLEAEKTDKLEELQEKPYTEAYNENITDKQYKKKPLTLEKPELDKTEKTIWCNSGIYLNYLEKIPSLNELVKTPFILSAVVQILPTVATHEEYYKNHDISRYVIYQYFIEHWLNKQAKRIWEDEKKRVLLLEFRTENEEVSITKLKDCLITYSENLARLALNLGNGKINVDLSEEDTLHPSLIIPLPGQAAYFDNESVDFEKLQLIRSGCLLQIVGNRFKFLHKSLVEFFAAKMLFKGAHRAATYYLNRFDEKHSLKDLDLNDHLLTSEPSIIYLLADQVREDIHFKYLLYQMIELSKGEPSVSLAAANAITILNAAGESFSGRDFRGVHIAGAVLNGALCDHTDFEGADLSNVTMHQACLTNANLSYAEVNSMDFGELPRIKHSNKITTLCIASKGQWLLVGDTAGYVTQYAYPDGKLLNQWYRKSKCFLGKINSIIKTNFNPISNIIVHPDDKWVACGGYDGSVQLIDIEKNCLGARFVPLLIKEGKVLQRNNSLVTGMTFCSEQASYLAFDSHICLAEFGKDKEYERNHLQLWDIHQNRFLGEYQHSSENCPTLLYTSYHSNSLLAGYRRKIKIFYMNGYKGGNLVPAKTLDITYFFMNPNGHFLASIKNKAIQIYRTDDWMIANQIPLLDRQDKIQSFILSYNEDFVVGNSDTQLYIWDLLSARHLFTLPIPEGAIGEFAQPHLKLIRCGEEVRVTTTVNDILYFWSLNRAKNSILYPQYFINLPIYFLEKTELTDALDLPELSIQIQERDVEPFREYTLNIFNKLNQTSQKLSYQLFTFIMKQMGETKMALSKNHLYLLTLHTQSFDNFDIQPGSAIIEKFMGKGDLYIRVWNLQKGQLHCTLPHPTSSIKVLFSIDNEWLVHGCKEVFIHRLKDNKELLRITIEGYITALALTKDKSKLFVADELGSLTIFNVKTQCRLYSLPKLPIIIRNLDLTFDMQYLIAKGKKEGVVIFYIIQNHNSAHLKLVYNNIELNLACAGVKIEGTIGLSYDNLQLFQQNGAIGNPIPFKESNSTSIIDDNKTYLKIDREIILTDISKEFRFNHAVIERDLITSFLNTHAVLNYSLWQVCLVRDAISTNNNQHAFMVVEGMDAFGRCFFWRFDLATRVGQEKVKEGFAKVVIKKQENILLSERKETLDTFLNPHEVRGRVLASLVGHVWQLERNVVLQLYREVLNDTHNLLPYAQSGNQSFFGARGDSCYSWARRRLLALKQDKINKKLPSSFTDYIAMVPSWKLNNTLVESITAKPRPFS